MQPADMGLITALKAVCKFIMLTKLLVMFVLEGGFQWASRERAKMIKDGRGLDVGDMPHVLMQLRSTMESGAKFARIGW